ncbi:hypothetical protein KNU84_gp104 [Bacteriophage DSS3_VP1]|uniref:Uncharacterized protein n=1 Tax=Bacteriophage DSS3_VP1 TaxID=2664196 RepID=A0A7S5KQ76_9CAUD|nr:hypothetical protein KNU84_gp104 [Bacteriophage DSS3_VP1]QGH74600.1 hypothetical protein DSS3VP1_00032 [Bacteriophage DSS3_VP1]
MSLRKTLNDAVDQAFLACGDLVRSVTLNAEDVTGFDNATQTVISTPQTVTADAILLKRFINGEGQIEAHFIFKAREVPLNKYIDLVVGSETFRIVSFDSNEFSVDVIAKKEN